MLADFVASTGISIYIISKYGIKFKSKLVVEKKNISLWEPRLYWRTNPKLGCEFSFIKNISKTGDEVNLIFPDMKISFEVLYDIKLFDLFLHYNYTLHDEKLFCEFYKHLNI